MSKTHCEQRGNARVKRPQRNQVEMHFFSLDQMIREDHLARTVVRYVDSLDLSELYEGIKATDGSVGRDAIDPRILFSLWLFATLDGESSGRRIAQLCERDLAYLWICGGVSVNYHTICSFRSQHGALLERILIDSITVLQYHDLIELETIAQDGMRVWASAGSSRFRRQKTLEQFRQQASDYLEQLESDSGDDSSSSDSEDSGPGSSKGSQSARHRAARERSERLDQACQEMEQMQERYRKRNEHKSEAHQRSEPRASTTDPQARRMKMGDNGFRPAYNVQFASDVDALVVVSVNVTHEGSDAALLEPMYRAVCEQYGVIPENYLADGGFSSKEGVSELERQGTRFYGKLYNEAKELSEGKDPYQARPREDQHYTAFRQRMGTEAAQAIYKRRAAAAEFPNAVCRNQGLNQFRVRGLVKTKACALWHALAYNFRRFQSLIDTKTNRTYMEILMTS